MGSKYFPELGYHLLYDCAALAELESGRGAAIETSQITNLRNNKLEAGGLAFGSEPSRVQARVSKDRWQAFRKDVDYFRTRVDRLGAAGPTERSRL